MNKNGKRGIPTEYAGTRFRSRLEARWAHFFTAVGWRWEYEPFDLDGYIPDFLILGDAPVLVEVKPKVHHKDLAPIASNMPEGDWVACLAVGVSPFIPAEHPWEGGVAGAITAWDDWFPKGSTHPQSDGYYTSWAFWERCGTCDNICIWRAAGQNNWPCGCDNHPLGTTFGWRPGESILGELWAESRNKTQWMSVR